MAYQKALALQVQQRVQALALQVQQRVLVA
jgi:hypothetical protein